MKSPTRACIFALYGAHAERLVVGQDLDDVGVARDDRDAVDVQDRSTVRSSAEERLGVGEDSAVSFPFSAVSCSLPSAHEAVDVGAQAAAEVLELVLDAHAAPPPAAAARNCRPLIPGTKKYSPTLDGDDPLERAEEERRIARDRHLLRRRRVLLVLGTEQDVLVVGEAERVAGAEPL